MEILHFAVQLKDSSNDSQYTTQFNGSVALQDTRSSAVFFNRSLHTALRCSHVSRRIRQISLALPLLWRFWNLRKPNLAEEFLTRSKNSPIVLFGHHSAIQRHHVFAHQKWLSILKNCGNLYIVDVTSNESDIQFLWPIMNSAPTRLLRLSLTLGDWYNIFMYALGGIPSIDKLCLKGVSIPWHECADLTHLTLLPPQVLNYWDVQGIISRSPRLQYCKIMLSLGMPGPGFSAVILHDAPCLRKMELLGDLEQVSMLAFLSETQHLLRNALLVIHSSIRTNWQLLRAGWLIPFEINGTTTMRIHYNEGIVFLRHNASPWSDNPSQVISAIQSSIVAQTIHGIITHPRLTYMTILEVRLAFSIDLPVWRALFVSIPHLRTLRADLYPLNAMMDSLSFDNGTNVQTLCPYLSVSSLGPPSFRWLVSQHWQGNLQAFLEKRKVTVGRPLAQLEIVGCGGIHEGVGTLLVRLVDEHVVMDHSS